MKKVTRSVVNYLKYAEVISNILYILQNTLGNFFSFLAYSKNF